MNGRLRQLAWVHPEEAAGLGRVLLVAALLAMLAAGAAPQAHAATFTVNSIADPGTGGCNAAECTLREAIAEANSNPNNADTVAFSIPGPGPHTIVPLTPLPNVTRSVTIDGTTEPGYAGTPLIELNGTAAGAFADGLRLVGVGTNGNSTVKGLAINRFGGRGIDVPSNGNLIQATFVGTNVTGTAPLGNGTGVEVGGASNTIGGTTAAARNVISGNRGEGLRISGSGATGNVVQGNYIGLDATGALPLGNGAGARGILINSAGANTIGGTAAGARNVVSANGLGIWIVQGTGGNRIEGNYIGTDASGTADLGNSQGIVIQASPNNVVGGTTAAARNIISGNNGAGVQIQSTGATGNLVQGNFIGTDASGSLPLGNSGDGVSFVDQGSPSGPPIGNAVGGTAAGAGNTIAFNGNRGVAVNAGRQNAILGNSIHSNTLLGIDLGSLGPTPNDPGDGDSGPNDLQNFPAITQVTGSSVSGTLNSRPNTTYRIEVFSSPACDPSGFGEGQRFLGATSVTTDASGNASFTFAATIGASDFVTATATDPTNNTSEFSACARRATAPTTLTLSPKADSNPVGTSHTVTATATDAAGQPVPGITVRFSVTGSVTTSGSCQTGTSGTCTFTYSGPNVPGVDAISAFADTNSNGTQDAGEPGDTAAKTWVAAAPNTLVLSPAADTNPVGTSHTVTATVRDAFTNPTPGIVVRFTVTGAISTTGTCTTAANGECTFTYTGPTSPGTDAIRAFADSDGDGTRDAGEPEGAAAKSWVVGPPASVTLTPAADTNPVGTRHTVTATVRDASGNPTPGIVVRFSVTGAVSTSGTCTTGTAGTCDFAYDGPTAPGTDAISAFADSDGDASQDPGEPTGAASKTWVPGAPASVVLSPLVDENPVGTEHTVTATVKDAFGNPTPGIVVRFTVTGAATAGGSCTTGASGTCDFAYNGPTTPGTDAITAFADTDGDTTRDPGEPTGAASKTWVPGPPASVVVEPAADTNRAGEQHCVTATVRDAFGNPTPGVTVFFSVSGANTASGNATTDAQGRATFCYTGTRAGADTIKAVADRNRDGSPQDGEPFGVAAKTYTPADPATLTLAPKSAENRAGEQHCVTATVEDRFGNRTPGVRVVFSVSGPNPTASDVTVVTDANGQATFCYTGRRTGADTISAFADTNASGARETGEPADTATKTWTPGPPASLTLTPATDQNPVDTTHTVTATVEDAFGNRTPGIVVRFTVSGSVTASGQCTTDGNGQCGFTYEGPELPGADTINAYADTNGNSTRDAGEPTGAATKAWVLPVSTPLCEIVISDGGHFVANNGDRATFGGNAKSDGLGNASGEQTYQDHGPAQPMTVKSISVLAIVCNADGTQATIFGQVTIDGSGLYFFRIDLTDRGEPGRQDTYRILLTTGYDSGEHRLRGGNIQIRRRS